MTLAFFAIPSAHAAESNECKGAIIRIHGWSLVPLLKDSAEISGYMGDCGHVFKHGDLAVIHYAVERLNPLIKVVFGLPGDKFSFKETKDGWNLLINGAAAKNSTGAPYILGAKGHDMLALYEHDYHGIIPDNAYLVLGDVSKGSEDSTRFGLIARSDILGFAERPKK